MRHNLSVVAVPFPKGLMSTARSHLNMPASHSREIKNMLAASDGAGMKRNGVRTVGPVLPGGEVVAHLMVFEGVTPQLLAVSRAGVIYKMLGGSWVSQKTGLNPIGTPRSVVFAGKLLLCNGFDPLLMYDGSNWQEVSAFVNDLASGLVWVSSSSFKIASDAGLYPVGSAVRATVAGVDVTSTVANVSVSGGLVTVVLSSAVLGTVPANLTAVAFTVKPPVMAGLAVAHDRLWGFGKGELKPTLSGDVDRMRVFYTYGVNDSTAWADPETGSVPSINLADKAGVADEVLAMTVKDGMTVFLGRNHMQLWSGSNPVYTVDVQGDFAWSKTIPIGVVHGSAVLGLPNDILFVSRTGARTLSRTLKTEQLDIADVGSELDPTFGDINTALQADPSAYKQVVAMQEATQGWFGLSMAGRTLVWQVGAFGNGWVVFDGAFSGITAACTAADGALYLGKNGQVYVYDRTCFDDAGAGIAVRWVLPWIYPARAKRFACKYVEVLMQRGAAVAATVFRTTDGDDNAPHALAVVGPETPDLWDVALWDTANWDSGSDGQTVLRDHVVATSFGYALESTTTTGPMTVFGFKLYGVSEQ